MHIVYACCIHQCLVLVEMHRGSYTARAINAVTGIDSHADGFDTMADAMTAARLHVAAN